MQQRQFGSSSEKTTHLEQMPLFNEAERTADHQVSEHTMEEITYKRKKQKGKREADLKDLPVETVNYTLSENEQVCPTC